GREVQEAVSAVMLAGEGERILAAAGIRKDRNTKSRMSSDSKTHGFRILVDHLPGNRNVFSVKLVGNIEFKCERIKLSGSVRRSQAMGNRDVGFFCADEIHSPRETMLSATVSFSV